VGKVYLKESVVLILLFGEQILVYDLQFSNFLFFPHFNGYFLIFLLLLNASAKCHTFEYSFPKQIFFLIDESISHILFLQ